MRHKVILVIAAALLLGCVREESRGPEGSGLSPWAGTSPSLVISEATRTVLDGAAPVWTSDDILTVFDVDAAAVPFTLVSGTGSVATFSTGSWTGKTPVYAAYSCGSPACKVADGTIFVTIPAFQIVDAGSFASGASPTVGAVEHSGMSYSVSVMRNVGCLLKFTFLDGTNVNSVTIEGGDGEQIAGDAVVTYSSMAWTAGTTPLFSVVLTPSGGGCFLGGREYYAVVLPGTYPKGLKITLGTASGTERVKYIGKDAGVDLLRGKIVGFGQEIDRMPSPIYPAEFITHLDFTAGTPIDADISLEGTYAYESGHLAFSASGGKILLPQIPGRWLNSLVLVHEATGRKSFRLCKASDDSVLGSYLTHDWKQPVPVAHFSPHISEQCYIALDDAVELTHVFLRYSSSESGSDAVKLGYEWATSPWNDYNGQGCGSVYTDDPDNFFTGIINRRDPDGSWAGREVPDPYTFTQTVNGTVYTFESVRPNSWAKQRMWDWEGGIWSCDYGTPNLLKLPRTGGKLVWVGIVCRNAYNTTKNRQVGILSKEAGESEFSTTVGSYTYVANTAQGSGDGSSLENSSAYKVWLLDDAWSPTRDYGIDCLAGSTSFSQMVLVYL